jgi:hypothetical protein
MACQFLSRSIEVLSSQGTQSFGLPLLAASKVPEVIRQIFARNPKPTSRTISLLLALHDAI